MSRLGYVLATALLAEAFAGLFGLAAWMPPRPRLVWNASASAPTGLYRIQSQDRPRVGDLIVITPPSRTADLMARRRYLPAGLPLLKHVAALAGARVCRRGLAVTIDGRRTALARARDRAGRALPVWRGCRRIPSGAIFVLNDAPDSFDSRYFGALPARNLLGTAHPLLTRDGPSERLRWHGLAAARWAQTAPCLNSKRRGDGACK